MSKQHPDRLAFDHLERDQGWEERCGLLLSAALARYDRGGCRRCVLWHLLCHAAANAGLADAGWHGRPCAALGGNVSAGSERHIGNRDRLFKCRGHPCPDLTVPVSAVRCHRIRVRGVARAGHLPLPNEQRTCPDPARRCFHKGLPARSDLLRRHHCAPHHYRYALGTCFSNAHIFPPET